MPDILFRCADCNGHLVVDSRGVGMSLPCPFCESVVIIPPKSQNNAKNSNSSSVSMSESKTANLQTAQQSPTRSSIVHNSQTKRQVGSASQRAVSPRRKGQQPAPITPKSEMNDNLDRADREDADLGKINEIKRLAAMMKEDEGTLASESGKRGNISFRCPSCGQVMTAKSSLIGSTTQCTACSARFTVPRVRAPELEQATSKSSKGKIPARRNVTLRTADDLRKSATDHEADDPELGYLDDQFQELIKRELEKLQGEPVPTQSEQPPATIKRKPPPPLAQHAEVAGNEPERLTRTGPRRDPDAPLPEMVALDSMDLDSEVAKQWGENAVVKTSALNWVATLVILSLVLVGVYFGYLQITEESGEEPNDTSQSVVIAPEVTNPNTVPETNAINRLDLDTRSGIIGALQAFHESVVPESKSVHVRNAETVLPLMQQYYGINDVESRLINVRSVKIDPIRYGGRQFYSVDGEYANLQSFHADFEKSANGRYLLDWEGWTGHSGMSLANFSNQGIEEEKVFRVWVEVRDYYNYAYTNAAKYRSYALKDKDDTTRLFGYADTKSDTGQELFQLFKELKKDNKRQRARLMLKLRFESDIDKSRSQVIITGLVNDNWVNLSE